MARLYVQGFDAFAADLEAAKNLTEDESYSIIDAGANIVRDKMVEVIGRMGLVHSGILKKSVQIFRKKSGGKPYVEIYPSGKHHTYRKRRGKGRKTVDAGEVGFILEYGAPYRGISGYHWMKTAGREAEEEAAEAMQEAFNAVLEAKGL